MEELTQKKIFSKYPGIFSQKDESMQKTAMCWGISTGKGWYKIIDGLCSTIKGIIKNAKRKRKRELREEDINDEMDVSDYPPLEEYELKNPPRIEATQVKEKFGGLRFYVQGKGDMDKKDWNKVQGAISMATSMSRRTCEECGSTKDVDQRGGGWIKTLCIDCHKSS